MQKIQKENSEQLSAIKIINKDSLHPQEVEVIRSEASILKHFIGKPHIV